MMLVGFVVTVLTFGQQQPVSAQPDAVIRSFTRLVQFSISVFDRHLNPIAGLTQRDFTVLDNGRPQEIAIFKEGPIEEKASGFLPVHLFSNRISSPSDTSGGHAVILLDWLNTAWSDQVQARDRAIQMLNQIGPNDRVAIYVLSRDSLRSVHEFGANNTELLQTLRALRGAIPDAGELDVSRSPIADASVSSPASDLFPRSLTPKTNSRLSDESRAFQQDRRVEGTIAAFNYISDHLAGVQGKKMLIWVSAGFPPSLSSGTSSPGPLRDYSKDIDRAISRFSSSDVAVYPVDARGLVGGLGSQINIGTMEYLASQTGGRAFHDRNDIDVAMRSALGDLRIGYTLGYYATSQQKGRHEIRIKLDRPRAILNYKRSYFVNDEKTPVLDSKQAAAHTREELTSPIDSTFIPLRVRATRSADSIVLQVSLDISTLDLVKQDDKWTGTVDMMTSFLGDNGAILGITENVVDVHIPQEAYTKTLQQGVSVRQTIAIQTGTAKLRLLVSNRRTQKTGTLSIPLSAITPE
jgi:VWFA-related protein